MVIIRQWKTGGKIVDRGIDEAGTRGIVIAVINGDGISVLVAMLQRIASFAFPDGSSLVIVGYITCTPRLTQPAQRNILRPEVCAAKQ